MHSRAISTEMRSARVSWIAPEGTQTVEGMNVVISLFISVSPLRGTPRVCIKVFLTLVWQPLFQLLFRNLGFIQWQQTRGFLVKPPAYDFIVQNELLVDILLEGSCNVAQSTKWLIFTVMETWKYQWITLWCIRSRLNHSGCDVTCKITTGYYSQTRHGKLWTDA